jgi:hypothetical protein
VRRTALWILALVAICAVVVIVVWKTGSPTTPMSFPAAIVTSLALSGIPTYFAGRAYSKRKTPFRFSSSVASLLLVVIWLAVAFVWFDWFHNGY